MKKQQVTVTEEHPKPRFFDVKYKFKGMNRPEYVNRKKLWPGDEPYVDNNWLHVGQGISINVCNLEYFKVDEIIKGEVHPVMAYFDVDDSTGEANGKRH
ncbi:hypothetical protein [Loigolactobacillus bifermentans]|uniref:Uncharacterized protein n=1 Tax=Loigolactobacillus bifermentans DSM 20003 TaxID=1423726 RepID=A0A0R1H7X9_9LACO|nr:hypothetical protein [Loigolactobacillus bifermentans]KRK38999.1 hypothetical protein FC07_GL002715 [Loigolactobacillus bifermentans DSM 20003]QGG59115.1 hypothetical protein LB003_00810 [Loigolactobacillus bifermentans]